jgi:hypothetical protein
MVNADPAIRHIWLPHWLRECGAPKSATELEGLKQCLRSHGVSGRGWRLYAEYGDGLLRPLGKQWLRPLDGPFSVTNALAYLRLLAACESDVAPPPILTASLAQCQLPADSISSMPVTLFRGAWRALVQAEYSGTNGMAFVRYQFVPAIRWFFLQGFDPQIIASRGKASWLWLQRNWNDATHPHTPHLGPREWTTMIRDASCGHFRFVPLESKKALENEGAAMQHCVATLTDCCRAGCVRVFSVQDGGSSARVATLAIKRVRDDWDFADLKGPRNSAPSNDVVDAAAAVLRFVRRAPGRPAASPSCDRECPV